MYLASAQYPPISVTYENSDAFNGLKENPSIAPYLATIGDVKQKEGKQRSTLRLYPDVGIYTIDSVYVTFAGKKAKSWLYSIISIRDYANARRLSIYPNLPDDFAYVENCDKDLKWKIDKSKTKDILGFKCYYATTEIGKNAHKIWFTNDLPYENGPFHSEKNYGCNLPGLVLEHIMGDGYLTKAIDVKFLDPDTGLKDKVAQIKPWTMTPKPSYSAGQAASEGMMILDENFLLQTWVALYFNANVQCAWLKE